jgi:hypothetical protein
MTAEQEALDKALSAVAALVSILAKGDDKAVYREAKVAERALEWVALRLR